MASFVLRVLAVTLGLFFIFIGLLKLSPAISLDLYREMRKQYIRMAKVFPLMSFTAWRPNAHTYRKVIAATEVTCGLVLVFIPGPLKIAANVLMILVNVNDIIANYQIKDGYQRMSLPIVFVLLLTCRLMIYYQELQREKAQSIKPAEDSSSKCTSQEGVENREVNNEQESKKTK
ncbi:hypothetical protein DPMN_052640 [Dreissena polymorpha]|uniref:Novel acetylcholine receptor chaperone n=2 Tax=Dreissena polymorpha TaxID=45954 RepID=A0A9D4CMB2_DREPO|nr:hypothetical protein DPMN_052640 [Dreissena polymorpha]